MAIKSKLHARFCGAMKARRTKLRITQVQLAEASGIDQGQISRIENGKDEPTLRTVERIASALNIAPEKLFLLDAAHA